MTRANANLRQAFNGARLPRCQRNSHLSGGSGQIATTPLRALLRGGTTERHCHWGLPLMPTDKQALLLAKMVAALPMFKCMRSSPLLRSGVQVWRRAQARGVAGKARSCGSILGRRSARNCNLAPRTSDWMQAGAFASRATHGLAMAQL